MSYVCLFAKQEAMEQSHSLLEKAHEQMEEQEDEIKKLNEVCSVLPSMWYVQRREERESDYMYRHFFRC